MSPALLYVLCLLLEHLRVLLRLVIAYGITCALGQPEEIALPIAAAAVTG